MNAVIPQVPFRSHHLLLASTSGLLRLCIVLPAQQSLHKSVSNCQHLWFDGTVHCYPTCEPEAQRLLKALHPDILPIPVSILQTVAKSVNGSHVLELAF